MKTPRTYRKTVTYVVPPLTSKLETAMTGETEQRKETVAERYAKLRAEMGDLKKPEIELKNRGFEPVTPKFEGAKGTMGGWRFVTKHGFRERL